MKEYVVVYGWTGENYSAYVPDLPGGAACADTLEETEQLMKEAIELYIQALKEERQPISEPVTKANLVSVVT